VQSLLVAWPNRAPQDRSTPWAPKEGKKLVRQISLYEDDDLDRLPIDTFLIYGDTGTGKTTCSGGFPRPLVLADETEGGWKSLRGLSDDQLFEPEVNPIVWGISEMSDMIAAVNQIRPLVAAGRVLTVVVSSITFYANSYLSHVNRINPGIDTRQLYGNLATHLREVRTQVHNLGVNVVWEALADHPESGGEDQPSRPGRPSIPGKSADQFSAGVGYLFRAALDDTKKDGKIVDRTLKLYTQPMGGYLSRCRIGKELKQLPNPLLGGYKGFLEARGYDVARLRKGLRPIDKSISTAPAAMALPTKPPIISKPKAVSPPAAITKPATATK